MANVIIVSNRLPVKIKRINGRLEFQQSDGGLATGLSSYVSRMKNIWIGWPGIAREELSDTERQFVSGELKKRNCYPIFLTAEQLKAFYNGYSNSILWPLFHDMQVIEKCCAGWEKSYYEANEMYRDAVLRLSSRGNTVWVHDYQLLHVPQMLRDSERNYKIGFFLHIPFPAPENFAALPGGELLLEGMLGADLVGFHTSDYAKNFLNACGDAHVGKRRSGVIVFKDREVRVKEFPMGIDYKKFEGSNGISSIKKLARSYKNPHKRHKVILTVDRLEPSKGLVERLKAYKTFLQNNPHMLNKVAMVMLATPSRTEIKQYQKLKVRVEKLVSEINAAFGTKKWRPVDYMYESLPFEHVAALYQIAEVAFITPLRDGMNLVAKEYVAARRGRNSALILSSTAGAAEELSDAILVNPAQQSSLVDGLQRAVTMPRRELRFRMNKMQNYLSSHTVHTWVASFIDSLERPDANVRKRTVSLNEKRQAELKSAYGISKNNLVLLDYDGTLSQFHSDPNKAAPTKRVLALLEKLAQNKRNSVVITSGRSHENLKKWFGGLHVELAAEHGAFICSERNRNEVSLAKISQDWKKEIRPILEKYTAKTPGAFIEEKSSSLVWHYRKALPLAAKANLAVMKRSLTPSLNAFGLDAMPGNKVLEIKSPDTNKGSVVSQWLQPENQFVLAIGDDRTDEAMFEALPPDAYSIKVGRGKTAARFRLKNVGEVLKFLEELN
jgi:trehalose 6-phosphate synthase/phosphatase